MKKLSLTIATLLTLTNSLSAQAIDLRIDNIHLYQADSNNFREPSTVYIDGGKIITITNTDVEAQSADSVVNANNYYAIPGLIDLHVHLGASGSNFGKEFQYLPVASHFNSNLYLGVTNIVDLFSSEQTIAEANKLMENTLTPNLFYAGLLFTNPGGHGTQFGSKALEVTSDDAIEGLWDQHMARKPHVTKAVIETFGAYGSSLTDSQLTEIGKRSKAADLPYFVHVSTLEDGKRAIRAGATALAHGINAELIDQDFIELMVKNNVAYIPTLAVYQNHSEEKANQLISTHTALLKTVPEKLKHCLFHKVNEPSKFRDATWQRRQLAYQNISSLLDAGITIGTGSDAGNPYTLHGTGLHNEIQALRKAGLSPAQIINAATANAAKIINIPNIGQLKQGFEASFILLEKNPIMDLSELENINAVYKAGQLVNREALVSQNKAIIPMGAECHPETVVAEQSQKTIDDFSGDVQFKAISDSMMGGKSTSDVTQQNDVLSIKTQLSEPSSFGAWAGTQIMFKNPVDASNFQGVKITYRGSKIPFGVSVYHGDVTDWDHFSSALQPSEDWQTVEVPFSQLKQFGFGSPKTWSAKNLTGLSFVWRTMAGQKLASDTNMLEISNISYF